MGSRITSSTSSPHYIHHFSIYLSSLPSSMGRKQDKNLGNNSEFQILGLVPVDFLNILLFSLFYNLSTAKNTTLNALIHNHCYLENTAHGKNTFSLKRSTFSYILYSFRHSYYMKNLSNFILYSYLYFYLSVILRGIIKATI